MAPGDGLRRRLARVRRELNADDPWITSHLELRDDTGRMMGGYGWVFPLGDGLVNIGAGTLATKKRPANINLRKLTDEYARQRRPSGSSASSPATAPRRCPWAGR